MTAECCRSSAPVSLFNESAVDFIQWVGDSSLLAVIRGQIVYMVSCMFTDRCKLH